MPEKPSPSSKAGVAMLVIDVQLGLFEKPNPIFQAERLLNTINDLVSRAHTKNIPVFYIQHSNDSFLALETPGWQLHPNLKPTTGDVLIRKVHGSSFQGTDLSTELDKRDVGRLVICGLVTHGCVKATCLAAHELGYQVILVQDGHSNFHKQAGKVIAEWNEKLSQGIAEVIPADQVQFI